MPKHLHQPTFESIFWWKNFTFWQKMGFIWWSIMIKRYLNFMFPSIFWWKTIRFGHKMRFQQFGVNTHAKWSVHTMLWKCILALSFCLSLSVYLSLSLSVSLPLSLYIVISMVLTIFIWVQGQIGWYNQDQAAFYPILQLPALGGP